MKEDRLESHRNQWQTSPGPHKTIKYLRYDLINYKDHGCILLASGINERPELSEEIK
jgi:hypothetical protein